MPKFIVTAKRLNRRTVIPARLPDPNNIFDIVIQGFPFEAVEADHSEIPATVEDKWYKDSKGLFYWGGGINELRDITVAPPPVNREVPVAPVTITADPTKISWAHSALKITDIWKDANVAGKNVRVAIIDQGFDLSHSDLKDIVAENFFDTGDIRHGTEMTGIIGAKGNKVSGIVPGCEMFFARVSFNDTASIVNALRWANTKNVDIISMSFNCEFSQKIETELKACFDKNIALIAAAGNLGQFNVPQDDYPASSPFCFAIGCFGKDFKRMSVSNLTDNLKLLAPGEAMLTAIPGNTSAEVDGKTSLATAFTGGSVALLLSVSRKNGTDFNGKKIIELLCKNADKRNNEGADHNNQYGFGLIDLHKTYLAIK